MPKFYQSQEENHHVLKYRMKKERTSEGKDITNADRYTKQIIRLISFVGEDTTLYYHDTDAHDTAIKKVLDIKHDKKDTKIELTIVDTSRAYTKKRNDKIITKTEVKIIMTVKKNGTVKLKWGIADNDEKLVCKKPNIYLGEYITKELLETIKIFY